ncbi:MULTISPECIES: peptidoglycan-binding domain-containing protein [unclassified Bradyrhizobium]|uniref:peptidoglycan-binding domain-containing protein n=1 Tax=unclassified Bradyrhizobium TaxID=2631580 RepID=UPI0029164F3D|nr:MULTISPECIES: peptidoglycan-binding domain-containing protein [unclassified Bradyrhizobium]
MPRRAADEDEAPRRRKRTAAAAVEAADERGLLMRALLYSPKDLFAGLLACAAASAIIVNAVFLQSGPHPAPMFGSFVAVPPVLPTSNPLPRPRPIDAEVSPFDPKVIETRPSEAKTAETKAVDAKVGEAKGDQKYSDPLADLVRSVSGGQGSASRAQQPVAQSGNPRRIAAVQRALTEYGYGQLKPTGMIGPDTQAAIQRFERERKLPVTGQVSDRMVRELAIVIGHPIE